MRGNTNERVLLSLAARAMARRAQPRAAWGQPLVRPVAHLILRPELWRIQPPLGAARCVLGAVYRGDHSLARHTYVAIFAAVAVPPMCRLPAAVTWTSNPSPWLLMWTAAYRIGRFLLHSDAFAHAPVMAGDHGFRRAPDAGEGGALWHVAFATGWWSRAGAAAALGFSLPGLAGRGGS